MKKLTPGGLCFAILLFAAVHTSVAQSQNAVDMFKEHVNKVVQKVEKTESPAKKRALLNASFDKLLTSFERVQQMRPLSENDRAALNKLKNNITAKKNELNGLAGYKRVPDSQLNHFANFAQQDLEQADSTITISVTVLLLIVLILLLL